MITTFQEWLDSKKIKLKPWQMAACMAFLKLMAPHKAPSTGKSFVIRVLHAFVDECGGRFAVDEAAVKEDRRKRGHEVPNAHDASV